MNDRRMGLVLRALRGRAGLRQVDVAVAAGVTQQTVSLVERGHGSTLAIRTLRQVFAAVDARCEVDLRWRGGELDRLLDRRHAALVEACVRLLAARGWVARTEVTYAVFGERGSIDVLGGLEAVRAALVVEVKSELASIEATLRKLDEKVRLVRRGIGEETFGWAPVVVACLLVLPEGTTVRRRLAANDAAISAPLPGRGWEVHRWLLDPRGSMGGVLLLPGSAAGSRPSGSRPSGLRPSGSGPSGSRRPISSSTHPSGTGREREPVSPPSGAAERGRPHDGRA